MAKGFKHGGSGTSPLSFKVVGGTAAPSAPREKTIWVNTDTEIHAWDISPAQPCRRSKTKNLLTYPYYHTTMTENGVTFTDNGDGTVKANGTATAQARFRPAHTTAAYGLIWLEPGTYTASGCPAGGSASTYFWEVYDADNLVSLAFDYGSGATFTLTAGTHVRGSLIIQSGVTMSNAVWKPQIEKGSSATAFVKGDASGQVWIAADTSGSTEFNALKKNGIWVYPSVAKQLLSGSWVNKAASIYQNGGWNAFSAIDLYLYNAGDACTSESGGWSLTSNTGQQAMALSKGSSYMTISSSWTGNYTSHATCGTANKVNVTGYNKLNITYDFTASLTTMSGTEAHYATLKFGLGTSNTSVSSASVAGSTGTNKTVSVDISALKTSLYVVAKLNTYGNNGSINLKIRKVWLS